MIATRWTKHLRPAAWLAALGIVAVIACLGGSARAADDQDDDSFDNRIMRSLKQSLGVEDVGAIDYRERSPLVVPPSRDLPPPENKAADNKALPADLGVSRSSDIAARRMGASQRGGPTPKDDNQVTPRVAEPADLGKIFGGSKFGGAFKSLNGADEVGTFTAEPPRMSLTAPPPGYQTPSPTAPYGITNATKLTTEEAKDPNKTGPANTRTK